MNNAIELSGGAVQEYSVSDVVAQAAKIQDLMSKALKDGQHYGIIPGTGTKPSLFKPGAEKINFMFRIGTGEPEVIRTDLKDGHREVTVKTPMVHLPTGAVITYGVGSCSTMETKYRYRNEARKCPQCGKEAIIKGREEYGGGWLCFKKKGGCGAKFGIDDKAITEQIVGQIENKDIADQYNTVLKMADKRSYICGTLKATAASDFFTQDVEDIPGASVPVEYEEMVMDPGPHTGRNVPETSDTPPIVTPAFDERKNLEAEIGRLATLLGADSVTAARKEIEMLRDMTKSGAISHVVLITRLKAFKATIEGQVAEKGVL